MALQTDSAVQFRPLNAFIAYRSFYNRMLPNMHQKERSGVLTTLWNADPYKNKWTLIAKVFSFLRDELGKDAVSLPSFLEHACSVLRIPALDAYLEQQGFSLTENKNGKLVLAKDKHQDLELAQENTAAMETTPAPAAHNRTQNGQVASNSGPANDASHHATTPFQEFKERNKENISVAAGVFAEMKTSGIQANSFDIDGDDNEVFGDEEAAAGLYAEHQLLQAVFDRGLVLNELSQSSETPECANHLNSHDSKKHLIQKLYSKAYEILIGGEYPVVIGAKGGFSHTIKHNPIAAAAQIFARDKPFDFDVLVVNGTDEVKNHVLCKVQPSAEPSNDNHQGSNKSNNVDSAFVLEPTGVRTTAVHKMAGPFSMDPENHQQWQKRQGRPPKKLFQEHDGENSTSLFTQKMAYQSAHNDGKFFVFSCQPSKFNNRIPSLSENVSDVDGASSHASSPEVSPQPTATSTRFINRSINGPLHRFPAVFTLPDPRESPKSIGSIDSIDSTDSAESINTIDNSDRERGPALATTPTACGIIQGKVQTNLPGQFDSDPFLWGGDKDISATAFHNSYNYSYGFNHAPNGEVSNGSFVPVFSINPGSGNDFGHNPGYGCNFGCDTAAMLDNNYFAAPSSSFSQENSCLSPTPAESVLGKRRHDNSNIHDSDVTSSTLVGSPLKRNRLEDDMHYLTQTLHQSPTVLATHLASRKRPAIFDEIYRNQRLEEAMAAACGDTAGRHISVATTMPLAPNPGPSSVDSIAAYFGRQSSSTNTALDLAHPQALDPLLGTGGLEGMPGLTGLGLGLNGMGLGLGMSAPQDSNIGFPMTAAPEGPPVYMSWPTSNMN